MMYGTVETDEERLEHLLRLRELQDETHGFLAFLPLAFLLWFSINVSEREVFYQVDTGPVLVPKALAPVHCDVEHGVAAYVEPNVWVVHRIAT